MIITEPGHKRCKYFRRIRKKVAKRNHIPLNSKKCKNDQPCIGTCPACEAEEEYLMVELWKRRLEGKKLIIPKGVLVDFTMAGVELRSKKNGASGVSMRGQSRSKPNIKDQRKLATREGRLRNEERTMVVEKKYPVADICRLRMEIDGQGVRTLIVFQNCTLRCKYCINAHTLASSSDYTMYSAKELYGEVAKDWLYLTDTKGGVTFGGGEPLLQSQAIREFAQMNKDGFSIVVESSLHVSRDHIEEVLPYVDEYWIDIKSMDPDIYHAYTGGNLELVLDNLKLLLERIGSEGIIVRIPRIPGYSESKDQYKAKKMLVKMGIKHFDLFDYVTDHGAIEEVVRSS